MFRSVESEVFNFKKSLDEILNMHNEDLTTKINKVKKRVTEVTNRTVVFEE